MNAVQRDPETIISLIILSDGSSFIMRRSDESEVALGLEDTIAWFERLIAARRAATGAIPPFMQ